MHITTSKFKPLFYPVIKVFELLARISPTAVVNIRYYLRFHRLPNLKSPQDLNEKILWLKLFSDTTEWTLLADKYRVRDYVKSRGLGDILIPLIGVWNSVDEIQFDKLPDSLIFKGTHDHTHIVYDLKHEDKQDLKNLLNTWLKDKNPGALAAEPQYRHIPKKIIAEKLLHKKDDQVSVTDYKIWCINGIARFIMVCSNRTGHSLDLMVYDMDWNPKPECCVFSEEYKKAATIKKPENLDRMIEISQILAADNPIVRVDLYNDNGLIYFGELTFTSLGGMMNYFSPEFLNYIGSLADLSAIKKIK